MLSFSCLNLMGFELCFKETHWKPYNFPKKIHFSSMSNKKQSTISNLGG